MRILCVGPVEADFVFDEMTDESQALFRRRNQQLEEGALGW